MSGTVVDLLINIGLINPEMEIKTETETEKIFKTEIQ